MSFKINVNSINNTVIPKLKEGNKNLTEASKKLSGLDIPSDFSYKSELKGYVSKIADIKKENNTIISNLNENVKQFKKIENANKNILNNSMKKISQFSEKAKYASTGAKINADATITLQTNGFDGEAAIEAIKDFGSAIINGIQSTGAVVTEKFQFAYDNVIVPLGEGIVKTLSSVANVVISLINGIANFAEHLLDAALILLTGAASLGTGVYDFSQLIGSKLSGIVTGEEKEWESVTKEMWKNTMSFTSVEHINNIFKDFYENNFIGKFLDENAYGVFKSDGIVSNVASGIGEVAGIVVLTILTLGIGTAAAGASAGAGAATGVGASTVSTIVGTAYAALNAFGKYTAEKWGELKESYQNKINDLFDKGKITAEEFSNLREEWANIKNVLSGLEYGGINAVWEGLQWAIGATLGQAPISENISKTLNSAINIFVDTLFNAGDTFVRAGSDVVTSDDKGFGEAFEENGGTAAVISSVLLGLIASTGGELFNGLKGKKGGDALQDVEPLEDRARKALMGYFADLEERTNHAFVTQERINELIEKLHIVSKEEWRDLLQRGERNGGESGFHRLISEESFVPESADLEVIIHELNHGLGYIFDQRRYQLDEWDWGTPKNEHNQRGINEAFTELIAQKILGLKKGDSKYETNVQIFRKMFESLEQAGYNDMDLHAYYGKAKGTGTVADIIDTILGDGTFSEITKLTNIADGCEGSSFWEQRKARGELKSIAKKFEEACENTSRWKDNVDKLWREYLQSFYRSI